MAVPKKDRPAIRDDRRYEAMREGGMSKEKAARIANTDATTAGRRGGLADPYEEWTKDELYDKARDVGIEGRGSMSQSELIDALRKH